MGQPFVDIVDGLIEATQPWLACWMLALAVAVLGCGLHDLCIWLRVRRSPVARLVRRRIG